MCRLCGSVGVEKRILGHLVADRVSVHLRIRKTGQVIGRYVSRDVHEGHICRSHRWKLDSDTLQIKEDHVRAIPEPNENGMPRIARSPKS